MFRKWVESRKRKNEAEIEELKKSIIETREKTKKLDKEYEIRKKELKIQVDKMPDGRLKDAILKSDFV
jgi:uncharacterized membrane protein YgaE (UPF0421/DUF939 family)